MENMNPRSPLTPLRVNRQESFANETQQKSLQKAKRTPRAARPNSKASTPLSSKKLVHLGLRSATKSTSKGDNLFKLTLAQTPGSAKKKKQQLKMMREDALNKAARCEAMGDYQGACDALVSNLEKSTASGKKNLDAIRSLKKRLNKQALLRKDSRGVEAKNVCMKLEEVLEGETKLNESNVSLAPAATNTTSMELEAALTEDPASPTLLMKVPAFPNELCAEPKPLGSTQKMTAVKANKEQKDQLGSDLVATPVRRSCRKAARSSNTSSSSKSDVLQSSGFAFTPNKFIPSEDVQSEVAEFEFNADTSAKEDASQATPTFNLGPETEENEMEVAEDKEAYAKRMLAVNTPNFPKLMKQKSLNTTPKTAIAKVLATLLNNSVKEGAKVENAPAANVTKAAWNSPRRTKKFLFEGPNKEPSLRSLKKTLREEMQKKNLRLKAAEELKQSQKVSNSPQLTIAGGKSVSSSLMFAREVEKDGSIDHKVGVTSISSQALSVEDCTENSLPVQEMEQLNSFHSGLTPKKKSEDASAVDALLKSPVAVKVRHFDSLAAENKEEEETTTTAAPVSEDVLPIEASKGTSEVSEVPENVSLEETPQPTSILKSIAKEDEVEDAKKKSKSVQKKKKKSVSFGAQLEQQSVEEAPVKRVTRATRSSSRKGAAKEESPAPAAVATDSSSKLETEVDYSKMTVVNLRALLKAKGLPVSGRKAELIERLTNNSSGPTDSKPVEAKKASTARVTRSTRSSTRNKK